MDWNILPKASPVLGLHPPALGALDSGSGRPSLVAQVDVAGDQQLLRADAHRWGVAGQRSGYLTWVHFPFLRPAL